MSEQQLIARLVDADLVQAEADRVLTICNACRYCEGFCAVFPAMAEQRTFNTPDVDYLANLCHNCMACYHACQYKPPHEFKVNVPRVMAAARDVSYQRYAWPPAAASLFAKNGLVVSVVVALSLILALSLATLLIDSATLSSAHAGAGAFYEVIPHSVMAGVAGLTGGGGLLLIAIALLRFCRALKLSGGSLVHTRTLTAAFSDALTLKHLGGGHDDGCNTEDATFSNKRRVFHQLTMWGFLLCFAATCVATFYEYVLGYLSPFPWLSLPVVLGSSGGAGLLVGTIGLLYVKLRTAREPLHVATLGTDYAFIVLLFFISLTGFLLLWWRTSSAMPMLLVVHLGFVFAFFLSLPYSKFVHGFYRLLALVKYHRD